MEQPYAKIPHPPDSFDRMPVHPIADPQITGAVLAGGLGTRLGGLDKGWIKVAGKPLIERVLSRLQPQVSTAIINANRHLTEYAQWGWPVVPDVWPDYAGPLAGISAALSACRTDWLLLVPVDAACLPGDLAQRLRAATREHDLPAAFVSTADGPMPVCCLVARAMQDDLQSQLAGGERSVMRWLSRHRARPVSFEEWPRDYWSLNTPEDRLRVEALLAGQPADA